MKDNDAIPSYQDIYPGFSLQLILKTKVMKPHHKNIWIVWDWQKDKYIGKKATKEKLRTETKERRRILFKNS